MIEKNIKEILDNLTIEQTERLIGNNMEEMKVSGKYHRQIENAVFRKISPHASKQKAFIPKKLVACIIAFSVIFAAVSVAAYNGLFTFIPGMGIVEKSDDIIYMMIPITNRLENDIAKANIISAVYSNGYLNVTVEVNNTKHSITELLDKADELWEAPHYKDFSLYINGLLRDYQNEQSYAVLAWSTYSVMLSFSHKTDTPTAEDIYEIAVNGFVERLSFRMIPCLDFEDISQIGPTVIQNGISLTATAQKIGNELIVWCYPFRLTNQIKDTILGYGLPINGSFDTRRYIETESGQIFENYSGWILTERFIFEIPENDKSVTLHIPYLTMLRNEKLKLRVNLPDDYTTMQSDIAVSNSLGVIRVTQISREPSEYDSTKDVVKLYFDFDNNDDNNNISLYSFNFDFSGYQSYIYSDGENGQLTYLALYVDKDASRVSLNITDLYYYLWGEYVIPLDVK